VVYVTTVFWGGSLAYHANYGLYHGITVVKYHPNIPRVGTGKVSK